MSLSPEDILEFWFGNAPSNGEEVARRFVIWFKSDPNYDKVIRERFTGTPERAVAGELNHWAQTARGSLALIILFDQFPRNIFRGDARAFATDERANAIAIDGIESGLDVELQLIERLFFYIPFEHAENLSAQNRCVSLYQQLYEIATPELKQLISQSVGESQKHRDVIRRFGRFPHRNHTLGRVSSNEEQAWAAQNDGWGQTKRNTTDSSE